MTNKEAIEKIIFDYKFKEKVESGYVYHTEIPFMKAIANIKKDLEVLEIIKERFVWLENGKLYCGRINDIHIPIDEDSEGNEEMELLREWLNEK